MSNASGANPTGAPLVTGPYDGSVPLAGGPSVLTVQGDEDWTLSVG